MTTPFSRSEEFEQIQDALRSVLSTDASNQSAATRQGAFEALGIETFIAESPHDPFEILALVSTAAGRGLYPEPVVDRLFFGAYLRWVLTQPSFVDSVSCVDAHTIKDGLAGGTLEPNGLLLTEENESGQVYTKVSGVLPFVAGGVEKSSIVFVTAGPCLCQVELSDVVEENSRRVVRKKLRPLDETVAVEQITFAEMDVRVLSSSLGPSLITELTLKRQLLSCWEMYGAAERTFEMTCEYVKTRTQFGRPVGSFQAVQHGLANMYLKLEAWEALARFATWALTNDPVQAALSTRSAIFRGVVWMPWIAERALQYHGGIGFTWEYPLHFFLKRIKHHALFLPMTSDQHDALLSAAMENI